MAVAFNKLDINISIDATEVCIDFFLLQPGYMLLVHLELAINYKPISLFK